MLPSDVESGVGTRTSLDGRLIFGFEDESGACGIPLNFHSPITLSHALLLLLTKFSDTSTSSGALFGLLLGRFGELSPEGLCSNGAFSEVILD